MALGPQVSTLAEGGIHGGMGVGVGQYTQEKECEWVGLRHGLPLSASASVPPAETVLPVGQEPLLLPRNQSKTRSYTTALRTNFPLSLNSSVYPLFLF